MVEKIRLTLWDIFSFFLTGFLVAAVALVFMICFSSYQLSDFIEQLVKLPAAIILVVAPLAFTLAGMLIEPFSNYFDRQVSSPLYSRTIGAKAQDTEAKILADEIRDKYLGSLNGKLDSPYYICKEYVETKQLSTTFMVFLSRYGFYRNCVFVSLCSAIAAIILVRPCWLMCIVVLALIAAAVVFKRRAEDFYSYMEPAIYRAFLIDKLQWKA